MRPPTQHKMSLNTFLHSAVSSSRSDSSHVHCPTGSIQHISEVVVASEVRQIELAPTHECAAYIPPTRLDLGETAHTICS